MYVLWIVAIHLLYKPADCQTAVAFNTSEVNISEEIGFYTLTLVLDRASPVNITANLTIVDVTTESNDIASNRDISLTFEINSTVATTDIRIIDDDVAEDAEVFRVVIVSVNVDNSSSATANPITEQVVTIMDNDEISVKWQAPTINITEGNGTITALLEYLFPAEGLEDDVQLELMLSGTATNGSDFIIKLSDLTPVLMAGTIALTPIEIMIAIVNDLTLESAEESIEITLKSASNPNVRFGSPNSTIVSIEDDETVSVSFSNASYSVTEGEGYAQVELTAVLPAGGSEIAFQYSGTATPGTALETLDFSQPGVATFAVGQSTTVLRLPIVNDTTVEPEEQLTLTLTSLFPRGQVGGSPATVYIVDDDTVAFNSSAVSISEEIGFYTLTLVLDSASPVNITVNLTIVDVTTESNDIGSNRDISVTFEINSTVATTDIEIIDDDIAEDPEVFRVVIASVNVDNSSSAIANPITEQVVTIMDNDEISVNWQAPTINITEGNGTITALLEYLFPSEGLEDDVQLKLMLSGTATNGSDFIINLSDLTPVLMAGTIASTPIEIMIAIVNDLTLESAESIEITLKSASNPNVRFGSPNLTIVSIEDDETVSVSFSLASYSVTEGEGYAQVELTAVLPAGGSETAFQYSGTATPGTALETLDFSQPGVATFAVGQSTTVLRLPIVNDTTVEPEEQLTLTLTSLFPRGQVGGSPATVFIVDDDICPCQNNGECDFSSFDLICNCTSRFTGDFCQTEFTDSLENVGVTVGVSVAVGVAVLGIVVVLFVILAAVTVHQRRSRSTDLK